MKDVVTVKLVEKNDKSYPIIIRRGVANGLPAILKNKFPSSKYVIVSDNKTRILFGKKLKRKMDVAGLDSILLSIPAGEKSKTARSKEMLERFMFEARCDRKSLIIALGGGVVGDLSGFVAATYMRGINYIQVPTTLLAMADSSIGGKTGIDNDYGKNLIGAFWQPRAVFSDPDFLRTLPDAQIRNGLAEAIKTFIISDRRSFKYLEKNFVRAVKKNLNVLQGVIFSSARIKAEVVSGDERESRYRMILNFGHTLGHAFEKLSAYGLEHGRAVTLGMLAEAALSLNLGILPQAEFAAIKNAVSFLGPDLRQLRKWPAEKIVKATEADKKSSGGEARYVLVERIGKIYINKGAVAHAVPKKEVVKTLKKLQSAI